MFKTIFGDFGVDIGSMENEFLGAANLQEGVTKVKPLCDGNADFTRQMDGKLVGLNDNGFGIRSRRYAMIVNDGIIEEQFDEPESGGDPYGVSSPESVMDYLNAK